MRQEATFSLALASLAFFLYVGPACVYQENKFAGSEGGALATGQLGIEDGEDGTRVSGTTSHPIAMGDIRNIAVKAGDQILLPEPFDYRTPEITLAGTVNEPLDGVVSNGNYAGFTMDFGNANFTGSINGGEITQWDDVEVDTSLELDNGERFEFSYVSSASVQSDRISLNASQNLPVLDGTQINQVNATIRFDGDVIDNQDLMALPPNDIQFSPFGSTLTYIGPTGVLVGARMWEATTALHFELNPGAVEGVFQPNGHFDLTVTDRISPFTNTDKTLVGMPMSTLERLAEQDLTAGLTASGSYRIPSTFEHGPASDTRTPSGSLEPIARNFFVSFLWNSSVVAHVPFGEVSPTLAIVSQLIVNNPYPETVEGAIRLFATADGTPVEATIDDVTSSAHSFSIGPLESRIFELDPTGVPLELAWAFVHATQHLSVAANFATLDTSGAASPQGRVSGEIMAEAGIAAEPPAFRHILSVLRDGPVDTGFAILNPTGGPADIAIKLTENPQIGERQFETTLVLPPRRQRALFPDDLFELGPGSFEGTLEIQADTSMAVISLKTLGGFQSSSLPSGTP